MLLNSLLLQPLGPAVVLVLGGLLLALGRRLARSSALWADSMAATRPDRADELKVWLHLLRIPVALLISAAAGVLLLHLRNLAPRPVLAWNWQPLTVAGSSIEWRLDGWNWLVSLLIILVTAVSVLIGEQEREDEPAGRGRIDLLGADLERTLWLAAAALAFVASGNILTLVTSWVLLDGALAYRLHAFRSAEPAARAWGALSLFGVLLLLLLALLGENGIRTSLSGAILRPAQLIILWFAGLVRAGVYPFHFWLTGGVERPHRAWAPVALIAGTAGLWLVARVQALGGPEWVRQPEWLALGVLALLGTALVAWTVHDPSRRWRWIALNRTGVAVVTAYVAPAGRPELLAWPLISFALGCALLAAAQAADDRLRWRAPVIIGGLILWGLPGAAGFLARSSLVFPTELPMAAPLFAVVLVAEVLFVASLWQVASRKTEPIRGQSGWTTAAKLAIAIAIAATPLITWGLFPARLAQLAGFAPSEIFDPLREILAATRRSVWIGLGVSAVAGGALGLLRERIFGQMRGWQTGIAEIAALDWLYRAIGSMFMVAAGGLRYFATLGEGEGYLGWLALAGFLLWVLLRA
jgi:hypothetical protein